MTIQEAIKRWNYRPKHQERLEEICRKVPDRFIRDNQISIPANTQPIYIPDKSYKSNGAVYAQLLKACIKRKEVISESLGLTEQEVYRYLEHLVEGGYIVLNDEEKITTIRYIPTPQGEEWFSLKNKVKRLAEALRPFIPNINITAQL